MRARPALACALALGLLGACGQKGPLYLPDGGGEVVTRPGPAPAQPPPDATQAEPPPADRLPQEQSPPPSQEQSGEERTKRSGAGGT